MQDDPTLSYAQSHLARGDTYDGNLASEPLSTYMNVWERRILKRIIGRFPGERIGRYLDFACGTGRITSAIAPHAEASYGVDVSESMISKAREKCPTTSFHIHDLTRSPLDIEPVDFATSFRFLGNAEHELRRKALQGINKHLKTGGYLVVNNHRSPWFSSLLLQRMLGRKSELDLTHGKLRKLLRETGFEVKHVYGLGAWLVLGRFQGARYLRSRFAPVLELLSRIPGAHYICVDTVIVSRKVRESNA